MSPQEAVATLPPLTNEQVQRVAALLSLVGKDEGAE